MKDTFTSGTNVVNANANSGQILGQMVNQFYKTQDLKLNLAVKKHLMDYQQGLDLETMRHKTAHKMAADTAIAGVQHNYNMALEGAKSQNALTRINRQGEISNQLQQDKILAEKKLTSQKAGIATRARKGAHANAMEAGAAKTAQDIMRTRESGRQNRLTQGHATRTGVKAMRDITAGLDINAKDPSKGISPLVAGPNALQNIGPLLKNHPLLAGQSQPVVPSAAKPARPRKPKAPNTPVGATPNPSAPSPVTNPAAKPAKVRPAKKAARPTVTSGGGLTEITPASVKTGKRGTP